MTYLCSKIGYTAWKQNPHYWQAIMLFELMRQEFFSSLKKTQLRAIELKK